MAARRPSARSRTPHSDRIRRTTLRSRDTKRVLRRPQSIRPTRTGNAREPWPRGAQQESPSSARNLERTHRPRPRTATPVAPAARTDPVANRPEAPILKAERANPGERRNAPSNPSHPLARTQNDIAKIVTTQSVARSDLTTFPVGLRGK